jgi:hypothetical protein
MDQQPSKTEMELAQAHIEDRKRHFRQQRARYMAFTAVLAVMAVILLFAGLPMLAFCALMMGFISLLAYFDADGQLQIVGLRSTRTLYPRMSILRKQKADQAAGEST